MSYADVESAVVAWLKTTSDLAPLLARTGGTNIFKAMPKASPLPVLLVQRVGGAPARGSDVPEDIARISFDCWAADRDAAVRIALTLVVNLEGLAVAGGFQVGPTWLAAAETLSWLWLPDQNSDTPRYVVDALVTAITE